VPFRFRRSITLIKGLTLNLSKSGPSISAGPRGARVTLGRSGLRATAGLPGSGLSYTTGPMKPGEADEQAGAGWTWNHVFAVAVVLLVIGYFVAQALN
jgi:hypothetical protein